MSHGLEVSATASGTGFGAGDAMWYFPGAGAFAFMATWVAVERIKAEYGNK
jgi:hypothetical protein